MSVVKLQLAADRMPRTRGECIDGPRPCPWTKCRHHLGEPFGWVAGGTQRMHYASGKRRSPNTCSLDLADRGGMRWTEIGDELGLSRERVRQIARELKTTILRDCEQEVRDILEGLEALAELGRVPTWEKVLDE